MVFKFLAGRNTVFRNVRIELPKIKVPDADGGWFVLYVNAPVMVALEKIDGRGITVEDAYVNGGGYSVYWGCSGACTVLKDTLAANIKVGYGHMFGIMYPTHGNMDNNTCVFEKVEHMTLPLIGSAWKSKNGVHVSVSNELLSERKIACTVDGKSSSKVITLPAHPKLSQKMEVKDVPQYKDLPLDIDVIVSDKDGDSLSCYDVTETGKIDEKKSPLIKTIVFSELDSAVSQTVSAFLVLLSILLSFMQ